MTPEGRGSPCPGPVQIQVLDQQLCVLGGPWRQARSRRHSPRPGALEPGPSLPGWDSLGSREPWVQRSRSKPSGRSSLTGQGGPRAPWNLGRPRLGSGLRSCGCRRREPVRPRGPPSGWVAAPPAVATTWSPAHPGWSGPAGRGSAPYSRHPGARPRRRRAPPPARPATKTFRPRASAPPAAPLPPLPAASSLRPARAPSAGSGPGPGVPVTRLAFHLRNVTPGILGIRQLRRDSTRPGALGPASATYCHQQPTWPMSVEGRGLGGQFFFFLPPRGRDERRVLSGRETNRALHAGRGSGEGAAVCPVRGPVEARWRWGCRNPGLERWTCVTRRSLGFGAQPPGAGRSPRGLVLDGAPRTKDHERSP